MKIHIFTCFPEFFDATICSLLDKARKNNILEFNIVNLRNYGITNYKKVDDSPYGGGAGMIMRPDVIEKAFNDNLNLENFKKRNKRQIFLTSPRGTIFNQKLAHKISTKYEEIAILCNRYEGVDQRAIEYYKMKEISIGKYILMGGETAAMCIIESVCRLIPNVIQNKDSLKYESFSDDFNNSKEYDHYTKPRIWNNMEVPTTLTSGHHAAIEIWRNNNKR